MNEELIRKLELDVAEHKMRINAIERLISQQNETLSKLSEQFTKLQNRLTIIGTAAVVVMAVSTEQGGSLLRALIGIGV